MATDELDVDRPEDQLRVKREEILNEVIPQLEGCLDRAFFIAALFATFFKASLFELWIQQPILLYGKNGSFIKVDSDPIALVSSGSVPIHSVQDQN